MYKGRITYIKKQNKILSNHHYGFRQYRSNELAIIELVDKITKAVDGGEYTLCIFLDLSKAFDTVNHNILTRKLEQYGVRGLVPTWFQNYLKVRKQIVKYQQKESRKMTISTGVLQGSVFVQLLFLLCINDMQNCSDIISFVLFADDTNAFYSKSCLKTLNTTMQKKLMK